MQFCPSKLREKCIANNLCHLLLALTESSSCLLNVLYSSLLGLATGKPVSEILSSMEGERGQGGREGIVRQNGLGKSKEKLTLHSHSHQAHKRREGGSNTGKQE